MTAEQAMERLNLLLAHAWMVRNFVKHAEEVQDDEEMLEVHRAPFSTICASVEPSYQRKDADEVLARACQTGQVAPRSGILPRDILRSIGSHQFPDGGDLAPVFCVRQIERSWARF